MSERDDAVDEDLVHEAIGGAAEAAPGAVVEVLAAAAVDGLHGAVEGAKGGVVGVVAGAVGAVRRRVAPTNDEQFEAARQEMLEAYAHRVPALAAQLKRVEDALRDHHEEHVRARRLGVDHELLRLVAEGRLSADDVETSLHLRDATLRAYRAAMDAIDAAVVPALARLATRYKEQPFDRFGRSLGRFLIDLEPRDFQDLTALAFRLRSAIPHVRPDPHLPAAIMVHRYAIAGLPPQLLVLPHPNFADSVVANVDPSTPILHQLVEVGLARLGRQSDVIATVSVDTARALVEVVLPADAVDPAVQVPR